ncbi:MAG: hypothetical protein ABIO70_03105 [Pseudomonadota bacterium]
MNPSRPSPTPRPLWALALAVAVACGHDEPVLLGVEPQASPEAPPSRDEVWGRFEPDEPMPATAAQQAAAYHRPDGVYVDMHWLTGRRYEDISDLLAEPLGAEQGRRPLDAKRGEEISYERGAARVVRGVVYMLRVELPEPLTRTDALLALGFNSHADHWRETHSEYRLSWCFGFARFRLRREQPGSDRVDVVEGWRSEPDDVRG